MTTTRGHDRVSPRRLAVAGARGFTLIEIIVVLAIVALIMSLGVRGFRSLAKSDLRASTSHLSGAIRYLFDRASTTGKNHRLVMDFADNKYWAEVSDDKFFIPREAESPEALRRREELEAQEDEEKRAKTEKAAADRQSSFSSSFSSSGSSSGAAPSGSSFDLDKLELGEFKPKRARFAAFKEMALKPVKLKNVVFHSVYTPRVTDPITSGRAYIYFFPLGQTEPAIVTLSDPSGANVYSIVVHPITGRARIYNEEIKPPVGATTDDEGADVTP
jgi:general secretion pathway protein H